MRLSYRDNYPYTDIFFHYPVWVSDVILLVFFISCLFRYHLVEVAIFFRRPKSGRGKKGASTTATTETGD